MKGLGRPGWFFPFKKVEHVKIWPPSWAGAWAGRGKGRWLEHDGPEPPGVALPSQKGRTCEDLAGKLAGKLAGWLVGWLAAGTPIYV